MMGTLVIKGLKVTLHPNRYHEIFNLPNFDLYHVKHVIFPLFFPFMGGILTVNFS